MEHYITRNESVLNMNTVTHNLEHIIVTDNERVHGVLDTNVNTSVRF